MRKHFLLLFLMALLPLVGWADDDPQKTKVIINAAYTYKTYGEVDPPIPNFEYDKSSPNTPAKGDIEGLLKLKRVTGEVGEDVGSYLYYIDLDEETYPQSNYEIVILQNNSNLVIQKADLHVEAVKNWKEFNTAGAVEFDYDIVNPDELQRGDTKDKVNAVITRKGETSVTEPVNGRLNQGVPELVNDDYHYSFKGEAKNYKIIVINEFYVVPATNVDNIQVTVYNDGKDAMVNPFVYRGTEYTPGAGQEEANLVVTDGSYTLKPDVDYTLILDDSDPNYAYKNNIHVGEATVTINFEGSYSYDTDKTRDGYFKIKKKTLKIKARSYTLVPGKADPDFEVRYTGWVNDEGNKFGPSDDPDHTPKGFKAPSGVTKVQIPGTTSYTLKVNEDAKADDYKIKYVDGTLTYGETSMLVTAVDKTKNYGDPDPKFTAKVKVWDNDLDDYRNPTTDEWAAIGGEEQPYYIFSREDGEDVGYYEITVDGPRVLPEGIIVDYEPGELFIDYKYVYLKGDPATKVYGEDDPPFDATVFGAKLDKETDTWIIDETQMWTRKQMDDEDIKNQVFYHVGVGDWDWWTQKWSHSENVTPDDAPLAVEPHYHTNSPVTSSGNYYVLLANGEFTITPAPLTIKADPKSKMYGEADPELTVTATELKFNDQIEPNVDYTIKRKAGEDVGRYRITVKQKTTSEVLKNYKVTLKQNWFTINPMELKVVAKDQAIDYGQTINPYDVAIYKKVNNGWEPWIEYIYDPDDPESAEALAEEIAKYLMLTTTVTKVGATQNAYTLVPADNTNYAVKTDKEHFTNAWLTIAPLKTIPLDENALAAITDVELKQVLEDHKGRILNVTLPARRMQKDDWYSWVLPFEVKQRDFFKDGVWGYGSMEILDKTKTTDKSVTFSLVVAEPIKANTPFIAKIDNTIESDKMSAITFKNVTIDPDFDYINNVPTTGSENQVQFIGVYEETLLGAGTRILARKTATSPMEFWTGDGAYLAATKAYLQFPTENAAREAKIFIEDQNGGTTEISGVKTEANSMNAEGWYNLNGVKMEGAPAQKGVYIKDGKKVVIK